MTPPFSEPLFCGALTSSGLSASLCFATCERLEKRSIHKISTNGFSPQPWQNGVGVTFVPEYRFLRRASGIKRTDGVWCFDTYEMEAMSRLQCWRWSRNWITESTSITFGSKNSGNFFSNLVNAKITNCKWKKTGSEFLRFCAPPINNEEKNGSRKNRNCRGQPDN